MSNLVFPDILSEDVRLISDLEGVELCMIDDSNRNIDEDDSNVLFESPSSLQYEPAVYKLEIRMAMKYCRYAINKQRNTIIILRFDIPYDYPYGKIIVDLIEVINSSIKLYEKCDDYLSKIVFRNDDLKLFNLINDFHLFLKNDLYLQDKNLEATFSDDSFKSSEGIYLHSSDGHYLPSSEGNHLHSSEGIYLPSSDGSHLHSYDHRTVGSYRDGLYCGSEHLSLGSMRKMIGNNRWDYIISNSRYLREYNHEKLLGSGSFGCVAKVNRNGVNYAIKQIPIYDNYDEILFDEASILASLQHRNIVRYYDAWIEYNTELILLNKMKSDGIIDDINHPILGKRLNIIDDKGFKIINNYRLLKLDKHNMNLPKKYLFILMEYCGETTLLELIRKDNLYNSIQKVLDIFRQILEALSYIHEKGIIHRDVKPSNIFINTDSNTIVKLGDFGLTTKLCSNRTKRKSGGNYVGTNGVFLGRSGNMGGNLNINSSSSKRTITTETPKHVGNIGTMYYMAPENINGDGCNEKVDIYSAGVVLFEMLSPPFNTYMERCEILSTFSTSSKKYPNGFREGINPRLFRILDQMLNIDPNKRPSASSILQDELFIYDKLDLDKLYNVIIKYPYSMECNLLLNNLFNRKETKERIIDYYNINNNNDVNIMEYINKNLYNLYRNEFKLRGALRIIIPLFINDDINNNNLTDNFIKNYYNLLLSDGNIIKLRLLLLYSFSLCIPNNILIIMRRWYWGLVYSYNKFNKYPYEHYRCAYDIIVDYGIIINDNSLIKHEYLDSFFTFELIYVSIKPLIKFLNNLNITIQWTLHGFIYNLLSILFNFNNAIINELIDLFELHLNGSATNFTDFKLKINNIIKDTIIIQYIIDIYKLIQSSIKNPSTLQDFISSLQKLSLPSFNKLQSQIDNLLYMNKFLTLLPYNIIFIPLLNRGLFNKFQFIISIKYNKIIINNLIIGGSYNVINQNLLQRRTFGFEIDLDLLKNLYHNKQLITTPEIIIYITHNTLLIHAKILQHTLQKHQLYSFIQTITQSNYKKSPL